MSETSSLEHQKYPDEIIESVRKQLQDMGVGEEDIVEWLARHIQNDAEVEQAPVDI